MTKEPRGKEDKRMGEVDPVILLMSKKEILEKVPPSLFRYTYLQLYTSPQALRPLLPSWGQPVHENWAKMLAKSYDTKEKEIIKVYLQEGIREDCDSNEIIPVRLTNIVSQRLQTRTVAWSVILRN